MLTIAKGTPSPKMHQIMKTFSLLTFPDISEDPLNNDHFLEAIQKIERENNQLQLV